MDRDKVLTLYEKIYFHELDSRDKLIARLQLSLALLSAAIGAAGYLVTKVNQEAEVNSLVIFAYWFPYLLSSACMAVACFWFIKALWGHTYECIPLTSSLDSYRSSLDTFYRDQEITHELPKSHFHDSIIAYYSRCSSANAAVNATRFLAIHMSMRALICSMPLLAIATFVGLSCDILTR